MTFFFHFRTFKDFTSSCSQVHNHIGCDIEIAIGFILESLPKWSWDNQLEKSWNEGYEVLMKFVKINGHGDVPARHAMKGFELGTWVGGQRYSFKKKRLSTERIALLEKIPEEGLKRVSSKAYLKLGFFFPFSKYKPDQKIGLH